MRKKSLVAMGLAGVMTIGMCVPVLAADEPPLEWKNSVDANESKDATTITGTVDSTYTINIPSKISEDVLVDTGLTISASNLNLVENKKLKISVDDVSVKMKLKDSSVTDGVDIYSIALSKDGTTALTSENLVVAEFSGKGTGSDGTDEAVLKSTPTVKNSNLNAGDYSGTVTFSVAYQ